jgi:hypothetical protein
VLPLPPLMLFSDQTLQQAKVLFVAIRREIVRRWNAYQLFFVNGLLVPVHEALVGPP